MVKIKASIIIGAAVFSLTAFLVFWNPLQVVQWKISDLFFRSRKTSDLITIIAIDEKSLDPEGSLGRFKDWPRSYYSQLLRSLAPKKPALVGFDLDFSNASRGMSDLRVKQLLREYERLNATPTGLGHRVNFDWYGLLKKFEPLKDEEKTQLIHPDDVDFQKSTSEMNFPIVLVSSLIFSETVSEMSEKFAKHQGVILPIFKGKNIRTGYVNVLRDRDGILRRFMPKTGDNLGFPLAITEAYDERQQTTGNRRKQMLIRYAAKPFSYRMISFVDALAGNYLSSDIEGKIVLVGAVAPVIQDFHPTPTSREFMPGVEINAHIVEQLLEHKFFFEQGRFGLLIPLLFLTLGGALLFLAMPLRYLGMVFSIFLVLYPFTAFALYQRGVILNVVYPEIAWVLIALSTLWYRNKTEIKEKKAIENAFSHYVSPVVVSELVKDPSMLHLGGKREQITVMFSDIVGFTTLAEKLSPEDTVALLNDYLTAMTEIIFSYHGTLDKYQGDAIMALFGAPLPDPHHAVNACSTALGMRRALTMLHEKWNAMPALPFREELITLDFRVGISTGSAVIGNVGSEKRFDYTAIGDIVNLGSRLESINRKYGTRVIVDKNTFVAVTANHNPFTFRKLDTVRVKGKKEATEIFELVSFSEQVTDQTKELLDEFENGRILYTQRNFLEAKQFFDAALAKAPDDGPSQIYRNRCNYFLRKPPDREWDAVLDLAEK